MNAKNKPITAEEDKITSFSDQVPAWLKLYEKKLMPSRTASLKPPEYEQEKTRSKGTHSVV